MAQTLKQLTSSLFKKKSNWKITLLKEWPSIVGKLTDKVTLEKITGHTLTLGVRDACWLHELNLLSPVLLHHINQRLDQPHVKTIRFRRIGIKQIGIKQRKEIQHVQVQRSIKARHIEVTNAEKCALNSIQNQELQKALHQFLVRCYQEREDGTTKKLPYSRAHNR